MKILVTGAAGFIGFHVVHKLLKEGHNVIGLDSINDYYQVGLKFDRLKNLGINQRELQYGHLSKSNRFENFQFIKLHLENAAIHSLFESEKFERVIHLAAQAGVRYSIKNPSAYINSNIVGFANLLESCRKFSIEHLVFASSSSVYGLNRDTPFSVSHKTDNPVSLYGATKKSNELMGHAYSHLFDIPMTGIRFFTVYGPWGRPDMAYFLFTEAILKGQPIKVFNNGNLSRDFTFVDDIVEGICRIMNSPPAEMEDPSNGSKAKFKVYNIGNRNPVNLLDFIETIEDSLGKKAIKDFVPMQAGDVETTFADVSELMNDFNYRPTTNLKEGVDAFISWYMKYYLPKNEA